MKYFNFDGHTYKCIREGVRHNSLNEILSINKGFKMYTSKCGGKLMVKGQSTSAWVYIKTDRDDVVKIYIYERM